jgi:DNA-binding SARP family transcriptional activator/DNA-binding beta-propeller fold protein YncE
VEFRILGPLEVVEDGEPVALGTLKERLVLGVLLLHANEFVSRERLIDELWGEAPPPTARKAVNVYISQLRKALGRDGDDPISTASGGYRLRLEPEQLDAERMQQLLGEARESVSRGEHGDAGERFRAALALWRGPTLAGLQLESLGGDEVARLDELRIAALMDRLDCDLALGRHEQVLGELNVLVREHPLRERLRAQQMLALYRADRQADALDAYAEARRTLVDDLGIEPSEALQRLQQAILRHDPSLETPEGTAAANGLSPDAAAPPATPAVRVEHRASRRFRLRRWQLALAVLVLLAASSSAAAILSTSAAATPRVLPNSLVRLDPRTGKPTAVVRVGTYPGQIAITRTAIWTENEGSNDVSRYDLRTHKVDTRGLTPGQPNDIAFDREGNAWITNINANDQPAPYSVVTRIDAGTGGTSPGPVYPSHTHPIRVPLPYAGLEALGAERLWVIVGPHGPAPGDNRVGVIDLRTDRVSVLHLDESATSIAFAYGLVWIGTYGANRPPYVDDNRLEVFRPGDPKPTKIVLLRHGANWGPVWIGAGDGAVWALNCSPGCGTVPVITLLKIDPETLQIVDRRDLSALNPGSIAFGAGAVWTGNVDNTVSKIDPRTLKIVRTLPLGGKTRAICELAATRTALWASVGNRFCGTIGS